MDEDLVRLRKQFDRLRGRLFQITEACGFPPEQAEAAKGVIRSITYDQQRAVEETLGVPVH